MASLRNHKVIEVWRAVGSDKRYHVTAGGWVLVTIGPKGGGAKLLYRFEDSKVPNAHVQFNTHGLGRRATATEARAHFMKFDVVQEVAQ